MAYTESPNFKCYKSAQNLINLNYLFTILKLLIHFITFAANLSLIYFMDDYYAENITPEVMKD